MVISERLKAPGAGGKQVAPSRNQEPRPQARAWSKQKRREEQIRNGQNAGCQRSGSADSEVMRKGGRLEGESLALLQIGPKQHAVSMQYGVRSRVPSKSNTEYNNPPTGRSQIGNHFYFKTFNIPSRQDSD